MDRSGAGEPPGWGDDPPERKLSAPRAPRRQLRAPDGAEDGAHDNEQADSDRTRSGQSASERRARTGADAAPDPPSDAPDHRSTPSGEREPAGQAALVQRAQADRAGVVGCPARCPVRCLSRPAIRPPRRAMIQQLIQRLIRRVGRAGGMPSRRPRAHARRRIAQRACHQRPVRNGARIRPAIVLQQATKRQGTSVVPAVPRDPAAFRWARPIGPNRQFPARSGSPTAGSCGVSCAHGEPCSRSGRRKTRGPRALPRRSGQHPPPMPRRIPPCRPPCRVPMQPVMHVMMHR